MRERLLPCIVMHVLVCDLDGCFVCALWRSRSSLGSGRGVEVPALLAQLGHQGVLEEFGDGMSHSAAAFLREYLLVAGECEESQLRSVDFPGLPGKLLTHVDRLFGFVVEQRAGCHACGPAGAVEQRYAVWHVLEVSLP